MARATVSSTPGLAETLTVDWRKAAMFYARFGISEAMFRAEVPSSVENLAARENPVYPPDAAPDPFLIYGAGT